MWELTTGCKPFAEIEHDVALVYKIIDGERPDITDDTPECFADLMKRCWDSNPSKRPFIEEIYEAFSIWNESYKDRIRLYYSNFNNNNNYKYVEQLDRAEEKRLLSIGLGKLGPKFSDKPHPKSKYISRLISNPSSTNSNLFGKYLMLCINTI